MLAATALLGATPPLAGQTVVGRVVEEGTGAPVVGAFVVLLDSAGERVRGALTDARGRFALRAPAPGTYRLRADRLGHASTLSAPLTLGAGRSVRRTLAVPIEAIALEGIEVEVTRRCVAHPDRIAATARLWRGARQALEVARWGEEQGAIRYTLVRHDRRIDPRTLEVISAREEASVGYRAGSPYESRPAETLAREGYVRETGDGAWEYFAPDAAALLSDAFLDTHCFRVEPPPPDEPGLVGLGFEPVPGRDVPDIEGVLWLERGSAELRRLDFTYIELPVGGGREWRGVGGRVEFERLATGMWVVRRWRIRMPVLARRFDPGAPANAFRYVLAQLHEVGGAVLEVIDASGRRLARRLEAAEAGADRPARRAEAAAPVVWGRVVEAGTELPLAAVAVTLADSAGAVFARAETDANGRFRFEPHDAGAFRLEVVRLGYFPIDRSIRVEPGRPLELNVRLSPRPIALEAITAEAEARDAYLDRVGFDDRRERLSAIFIDRDEIERRAPSRMTQLFAGRPGVRLQWFRVGNGISRPDVRVIGADRRLDGRDCRPKILMDGVVVRAGGVPSAVGGGSGTLAHEMIDAIVDPRDVEAIEVYTRASHMPARYAGTGAACGLVLIWTRRD